MYMEIWSDDRDTITLPVHHSRSEGLEPRGPFDDPDTPLVVGRDRYVADHPGLTVTITKVCFYSDTLEMPVQFMLNGWTLSADDEGCWELTIKQREYGRPPDPELEFQLTKQYGKRLRDPLVFQWMDKGDGEGEMVVN
jgi:hypothetical protein